MSLTKTLGADGWTVDPIDMPPAHFSTDVNGNTALVHPVGGLEISNRYKTRKTNVLTKSLFGGFTTVANAADHTTFVQTCLEGDFDAVRLLIPNAVAADVTGVKVRMCVTGLTSTSGSTQSISPADGTYTTLFFSGVDGVTLPAGVSGDAPSWTASDWKNFPSKARTDGGTLPVLHIRILIPAANANRSAYSYPLMTDWEDETITEGRIWRARTQAVDGVTVLGNFTAGGSVSNYQCHPVVIQYLSRKTGATVMVVGDSIFEGAGAPSRRGWHFIGQASKSSTDFPIEICNLAIGGSNSATWKTRLQQCIQHINPDFVVIPGYEANDITSAPITDTMIRLMRGYAGVASAETFNNGALPVLCTGLPRDPTGTYGLDYGSSDSLRRALNDEIRANAIKTPMIDFDLAVAGETDVDGQVLFAVGTTNDALHPNDVGHASMAVQFGGFLDYVIAANSFF